jgi:chemotaxis protein CheD
VSGPAALSGCRMVKIGPGELHVTRDPDEAIVTVLGSCVAACLSDPVAGVGGMNHFMLPQPGAQGEGEAESGSWHGAAARLRYGSVAMAELVERLQQMGARVDRMEAKLFGAARLGPENGMVGEGNARFAEAFLRRLGLMPRAKELGGVWARRVAFHAATGRAFMSELREKAPVPRAARG